jgi:LmbE family N-acetylglucosaminyl deacetylase
MKKILVIAAHPDDEILGCAGTVARLVKQGYQAYTLILGEGIEARYKRKNTKKAVAEVRKLKSNAQKANKIIGVKKIFIFNFPDNSFDSLPLLKIVKVIEKVKEKVRPDLIFTHFEKDLNIDHQITYKAVITATRPLVDETVREIYSFSNPSSTEWSYPLSFSPNVFFDVTDTLDLKLAAVKKYKSELRELPHPRSLKGIKLDAQYWGMRTGLGYAEAFKCVRSIK